MTRLGFAVNESQLTRYERGTQNIKSAADGAAESFRQMFLAFAGLSALKGIVNIADSMQSLEFRIGELTQTVLPAGQAFEEIARHAVEARQDVDAYGQLYVRVAGSTDKFVKSQEDVLKITDTVSKALVLGGATAREQESAMFQLAQGFQAGRFQGNDFKIFMAAMSTDFKRRFADAMGSSIEKLKEMSSEGEITAEKMAMALLKIAPDFDESFKRVPMTMGQAFAVIRGNFSIFIARMNRESQAITKIAGFFVNTFKIIDSGVNSIVDSLEGGGQALKIFGIAIAAALAPAVIRLFVGAVGTIMSPMFLAIATIFAAGLALEDLYTWFNGGESVIGRWIGGMKDAEGRTNYLSVALVGLVGTLGLLAAIAPLATLGLLTTAFNGLAAAIFINIVRLQMEIALYSRLFAVWVAKTIPAIWAQVTAWAAASLAALGVTIPLWAIIAIIAAIGLAIYVLYKIFTGQFGDIKDFVMGVWDGIASGFRSMVDGLMEYWKKFKSFWGLGASTSLTVNGANQPNVITPSAALAGGGQGGAVTNVTINQELPPGTPQETAVRANDATKSAIEDFFGLNKFARQAGQAQ